ncbi:tail fiber protein [Xenorhabdus thailandensis]|uniref:tail fiber protein n=1 Tax=Xenorhabdus thailandensis TaxID=3136255 RepID=UPI003BF51A97
MNTQNKKPEIKVLELEDDGLVVVATPEYVKDSIKEAIEEHAQSRNHPYATLEDRGFVTLSNDIDSDSEVHAATSKAVKAAYDLANTANKNALKENVIGVGQNWQNVTNTRKPDTVYVNETSSPIQVIISAYPGSQDSNIFVNGVHIATLATLESIPPTFSNITFIVPAGMTYMIQKVEKIENWSELR